jgi:hypothetical protein
MTIKSGMPATTPRPAKMVDSTFERRPFGT